MDKIIIKGLEIFAHHGVYDEEKAKGQAFVINAEFGVDTVCASLSDDIDDTLDYAKACEYINDYMVNNQVNLIETLANELSRKLLVKFPSIKSVMLEVCKPHAPIPLKFENVYVHVERCRHTAYISVGSNMGDSEDIIKNAIDNLGADECIDIKKISSIIKTKPYGYTDQDDFLNGAFKIETLYSPDELLARLHIEEYNAGRERKIHWGPRTLDLDIIFYDDVVMLTDSLTIPHPDMQNREFVLGPICEIEPGVIHPRFMLTAKELFDKLQTSK
ncbi:MAG: 2-amino-4-hydroxy-6-hydroxymethyldihydropteridine diphosphokinase [Lachnospiraceae bacterium]|nr:2-amino-4-hydroxy-6-hydroxymethyldihydropteridine diphosphokinase [Lachnospiraceae bacterium]